MKSFYLAHRFIRAIAIFIGVFVMSIKAEAQSPNIIAGVIDQLVGSGKSLETDYAANQKWLMYIAAKPLNSGIFMGGVKVLIDLDDYAGVTKEGQDGWVTVWVDVVVSSEGMPMGLGVQKRSFDPNAPDSPTALLDLALNSSIPCVPVNLLKISSAGELTVLEPKLGFTSPLSAIGAEFSVHGLSFEIRKTNLDQALLIAAVPGLAINVYATQALLSIVYPGASFLRANIFGGIRMATFEDDPDFYLIRSVTADRLVQGQQGNIKVDVVVKTPDTYHVRVWDDKTSILYPAGPNWNWVDTRSYDNNLIADQPFSFQFQVTPTSPYEGFAFWLYQQDAIPLTFKIIEKVVSFLDAAPPGTDVTPPSLQIVSPSGGNTLQSSADIQVDVSDQGSGIDKVDFFLGNRAIGTLTSSPWVLHASFVGFSPGSYVLRVVAHDVAGNGEETTENVLLVDSPRLNAGSLTPATGSPKDQFEFSVTYQSDFNTPPDYVRVNVDGKLYPMSPSGTDWVKGVPYTCNNSFGEGQHNYHFEAGAKGKALPSYPASGDYSFEVKQNYIALSFASNPASLNQVLQITAAITPPQSNYPINFYSSKEDVAQPSQGNPVYTDSKGIASTFFSCKSIGIADIVAQDANNSANRDIKRLTVENAKGLSIFVTYTRDGVVNGQVQYRLQYRVTENTEPYDNFDAVLTTDFGKWDNGQQTKGVNSKGSYIQSEILTCDRDGSATVTFAIGANSKTCTIAVQLALPPLSAWRVVSAPSVEAISWSPVDDKIAFSMNDYYLKVYDVSENSIVKEYPEYPIPEGGTASMPIRLVRFSPDGKKIFISGNMGTRIIDANSQATLAESRSIAFGSFMNGDAQWVDNSSLLIGHRGKDGATITNGLYSSSNLALVKSVYSSTYYDATIDIAGDYALLAFSSYPKNASGYSEGHTILLNRSTWGSVWPKEFNPPGNGAHKAAALSPDGMKAAIADDYASNGIFILNSLDSRELGKLGEQWVTYLDWNPYYSSYLAVLCSDHVAVWDINSATTFKSATDIAGGEGELFWASNGEMFAISDAKNQIKIYAPFDNSDPSIAIIAPSNNAVAAQSDVVLSGFVSDDRGVASARYRVNAGSWIDLVLSNPDKSFSKSVPVILGPNNIEVQAFDLIGRQATQVITVTRVEVQRPVVPQPVSPLTGSMNLRCPVVLQWSKSLTATSYRVQIAKDIAFSSIVLDDSTLTATDFTRTLSSLDYSTTYYWRVCASNIGGSSGFSNPWSFQTAVALPLIPNLATATDGSIVPAGPLVLCWRPSLRAEKYWLQVAVDPSFVPAIILINDSTLLDTLKQLSQLSQLTEYYWRVNATNAAGASGWSLVWSFTTMIAAPQPPALAAPADSMKNASLSPTLSWNASQGAITYHLQLSSQATFTSFVVDDSSVTTTSRAVGQLSVAKTYYWRVRGRNDGGWSAFSPGRQFSTIQTTSVEKLGGEIPKKYALSQNYPNPFNPTTIIQFALPNRCQVSVKVFDVLGKEVAALVSQELGQGYYSVRWQAGVPSGTYIYRLQAGEFVETKKMIVLH
jgi:hypothetical protein